MALSVWLAILAVGFVNNEAYTVALAASTAAVVMVFSIHAPAKGWFRRAKQKRTALTDAERWFLVSLVAGPKLPADIDWYIINIGHLELPARERSALYHAALKKRWIMSERAGGEVQLTARGLKALAHDGE